MLQKLAKNVTHQTPQMFEFPNKFSEDVQQYLHICPEYRGGEGRLFPWQTMTKT